MPEVTITTKPHVEKQHLPPDVLANNGPTTEVAGVVVPAKFVRDGVIDTAALVKSYTHLEKMASKQVTARQQAASSDSATGGNAAAAPKEAPPPDARSEQAIAAVVPPAVGSFTKEEASAWSEEIAAGGLSDDSYSVLEKRGFSREIVDTFIAGQKAIALRANDAVYALVGGKDSYAEMIAWAGRNLDRNEALQFNAALKTDGRDMAVKGLWARHRADVGVQFVGGSNERGVSSYSSQLEMMSDIKDPRYQTDAAFRARVEAKVGRSKF